MYWDREALISALTADRSADVACKGALTLGAVFRPPGEPIDTAPVITIYERRVRSLAEKGIRSIGLDDLVDRLRAAGSLVRAGQVHSAEFNYVMFFDATDPVVVACLGVDASVANPEWDYSDWSH